MKSARSRWGNRSRQLLDELYTPDEKTKVEAYEQLHAIRVCGEEK